MSFPFDPECRLIDWKDGTGFTTADATCGVFISGATGAGKTSGPGKLWARAYLKALMGGIVLCAKVEERRQWEEWARMEGREDDLVVFAPGGGHCFDFLAWEAAHGDEGGGQIINTVLLLDEIARAAAHAGGASSGSGGDSAFFEDALHLMLTALVALAIASGRRVTLPYLRELAASAPRSLADLAAPGWHERSACAQLLARLAARDARETDADKRADIAELFTYWAGEWPELSSRTRSIVDMMFSMLVTPFLYPPLRQLFTGSSGSSGSTITPEAAFDGKIIIIDLPVQEFRLAGQVAALVWKHCFQIAVMRRSGPRGSLRPVFLWADEAQNFVTARDAEYQAVARSNGGCTVYLTQQRESLVHKIGETATENLLANLQLKLFCQNTGATNQWASDLIGERFVQVTGMNIGRGAQQDANGVMADASASSGISRSEQKRAFIEPSRFQSLKRGGPANGYIVEAVAFMGGKTFGKPGQEMLPYKILAFAQRG